MKQHYIPRCYLKRFSDNEKSIHTFDKIHCNKYNASLMSVFCEPDLYTMSEKYFKENNEKGDSVINRLSIETDHFSHSVELSYSLFLAQIDEIKINFVYKLDGKHPFLKPNHKAEVIRGLKRC